MKARNAALKAKIAFEAARGAKTIGQLASARTFKIDRTYLLWCADITYIRIG